MLGDFRLLRQVGRGGMGVAARTLWPRAEVPQLLLGKAYYLKGDKENAEKEQQIAEETFEALYAQAGDLLNSCAASRGFLPLFSKWINDFLSS